MSCASHCWTTTNRFVGFALLHKHCKLILVIWIRLTYSRLSLAISGYAANRSETWHATCYSENKTIRSYMSGTSSPEHMDLWIIKFHLNPISWHVIKGCFGIVKHLDLVVRIHIFDVHQQAVGLWHVPQIYEASMPYKIKTERVIIVYQTASNLQQIRRTQYQEQSRSWCDQTLPADGMVCS